MVGFNNNFTYKKFISEKLTQIIELPYDLIKNQSFEEKQIWFKFQIETMRISWTQGSDPILITKENIINDTLNFINLCDMHKVMIKVIYIIFFRRLKFILKMIKLMMLEVFLENGSFF